MKASWLWKDYLRTQVLRVSGFTLGWNFSIRCKRDSFVRVQTITIAEKYLLLWSECYLPRRIANNFRWLLVKVRFLQRLWKLYKRAFATISVIGMLGASTAAGEPTHMRVSLFLKYIIASDFWKITDLCLRDGLDIELHKVLQLRRRLGRYKIQCRM